MPDDVELASLEAPPRDSLADAWPRHPDDGIPGSGGLVFIVCFLADLAMMAFGPAIRGMLSFVLPRDWADALLFPALWGFAGAQLAMLCIWLGIMATALYWSLAGMIVFTAVVLALIPNKVQWPSVLQILTVVFTF